MPDQTPPNDDFSPLPEYGPTTPGGEMGHVETNWPDPDLSDRQLRAVELLTQGHTDVRVASILGISRKTLWRWKTCDDHFRLLLNDTRMQNFHAAIDRYQNLLTGASKILSDNLKSENEDDRFRAAAILFNMAGAFRPRIPKDQLPKIGDPDDDEDWPVLPPKIG